MPKCHDCSVAVQAPAAYCPLCHKPFKARAQHEAQYAFPDIKPRSRLLRLGSIAAIMLVLLSVVINILTWRGVLWSAVVSASVLYVWFVGNLSFRKRVRPALKLIAHAAAIALLLFIINAFTHESSTISRVSWAISFGLPILLSAFTLAISIIMLLRKQSRREFLFFQFILCIICFVPLVLVLCGIAQPVLPSIIAAGWAFLSIVAVVLMVKDTIKSELARKFHV